MITFDTEQITFDSLLWTFDGWYQPVVLFGITTVRCGLQATINFNGVLP